MTSARAELLRQQVLLAAIWGRDVEAAASDLADSAGIAGSPARIARGLAAYRGNVEAAAARALASAFPTVQAMVGAGDFSDLARTYLGVDPPQSGDLGEWGERFPAWLRELPALVEWPYLGDSATLDWALHCCERAADAEFDAGSLGLLERLDPKRLHLRLRPGSAVLASTWPIATIHAAHRDDAGGFDAARAALAARRAEQVLVVRSGWRGVVHPIDLPTFDWMRDLLDGCDLGRALERAGPAFDFAEWLASALRGGWLQAVACSDD
jgi:hypothetical protein